MSCLRRSTVSERGAESDHGNAPLRKVGKKIRASGRIMPHSRPTLMAVRTLSPVTMRVGMCAARRVAMAGAVPGLSLFSKTMMPRKRKSDSTASLQDGANQRRRKEEVGKAERTA